MKKTLRKIILLFSILVSMTNILFLSSTILSSERFYSDVIPDLLCIRRGYPFVFISINNSGNCFDTKKLLLNVLCSMCVSICIIILVFLLERKVFVTCFHCLQYLGGTRVHLQQPQVFLHGELLIMEKCHIIV